MNSIINKIQSVISGISLSKVINTVILFVVLIIISRSLAKIIEKVLSRTKLGSSFAGFLTTIIKYVMYFISVLIVCDTLGLPVTSLLALLSLFGLAVSLSVQSLLSNLMSGLTVHTLKPFEIGDYIETDIAGTVKSIGLFYTELLTPDNKKVYIPNEKVMANRLINYTSEPIRRIELVFNAEYSFDTDIVISALREAVDSVDVILKEPECIIGISEYGDSAIKYSVWAWTDADKYLTAKFAIMDAVPKAYSKHGISMAYNRLQVEMINMEEKSID